MGCRSGLGARGLVAALGIGWLLVGGCTQVLPPPEAPPPIRPQIPVPPENDEGEGTLVVDVADGPSTVFLLTSETVVVGRDKDEEITRSQDATSELCMSPCAVSLPFGQHILGFPSRGRPGLERAPVTIGEEGVLYRYTLGYRDPAGAGQVLGIVGTTFGGMALVTGLALMPVGLARPRRGAGPRCDRPRCSRSHRRAPPGAAPKWICPLGADHEGSAPAPRRSCVAAVNGQEPAPRTWMGGPASGRGAGSVMGESGARRPRSAQSAPGRPRSRPPEL